MQVLNELNRIRQVMGLTPYNPKLKNNLKENNLHTSRVITEQSNVELLGRKVQINPDGSIYLENNKKKWSDLDFRLLFCL